MVRILVLELASDMSSTCVCTLATGFPSTPVPSEEHVQLRISDCWSRDHVILYVVLLVCGLNCADGCESLRGFA